MKEELLRLEGRIKYIEGLIAEIKDRTSPARKLKIDTSLWDEIVERLTRDKILAQEEIKRIVSLKTKD